MVRLLRFLEPLLFWRDGFVAQEISSFSTPPLKVYLRCLKSKEGHTRILIQVYGKNPLLLLYTVVECIEKFIENWYENLTGSVKRYLPCPHCLQLMSSLQDISLLPSPATSNLPVCLVQLELCEDALFGLKEVSCGATKLAKEDFLRQLLLPSAKFISFESLNMESTLVGIGSSAKVFRGKYDSEMVAVKKLIIETDKERRPVLRSFFLELFYLKLVFFFPISISISISFLNQGF
jgi:hypothetical protein